MIAPLSVSLSACTNSSESCRLLSSTHLTVLVCFSMIASLSVSLSACTNSSESYRLLSSTHLTVLVCCSMIASVCLSVCLPVLTHLRAVDYYLALISQCWSVVLWLPLSVCLSASTNSSKSCRLLSSTRLTVLVCCSMIAFVCLPVLTHLRTVGYYPALISQCWSVVLWLPLSVCQYLLIWEL